MPGDAIEPPFNSPCGECHMPNPPDFHPFLHCLIWKALSLDPEMVLAEYGYVRKSDDD